MLKKFRESLSKALIFMTLFGGTNSLNSKAFVGLHEMDQYKFPPFEKFSQTKIHRNEIIMYYVKEFVKNFMENAEEYSNFSGFHQQMTDKKLVVVFGHYLL